MQRKEKRIKIDQVHTTDIIGANKQQRVTTCLMLLYLHCNLLIFDQVLTSAEKCVMYERLKTLVLTT